jgi:hypothetical protein
LSQVGLVQDGGDVCHGGVIGRSLASVKAPAKEAERQSEIVRALADPRLVLTRQGEAVLDEPSCPALGVWVAVNKCAAGTGTHVDIG